MKTKTIGFLAALMATMMVLGGGVGAAEKDKEAKAKGKGVLRHVVLFKFKESATAEQVREIEKAFAALPSKIDTIVDFEWGTDVSPEGKAKGFTHLFFVTFKNQKGLDVYLPHEAHQDFVLLLKPQLEDVLVFDYFAGG